jgi:hypothetical protein
MMVSRSSPGLTAAERDALAQVLNITHLSIGPRLDAFERAAAGLGVFATMAYNDFAVNGRWPE